MAAPLSSIDQQLFRAMPGSCALLLPDAPTFTIVTATDDYLKIAGRTLTDIVGKGLFEAFPVSPEDADLLSENKFQRSLENVVANGELDRLAYDRYDIANEAGLFEEHYWSIANKPVFNESGTLAYIIHYVEDVTPQVVAERRDAKVKDIEKAYGLFMQAPVILSILKGEELVIEMANEAALKLWGKTDAAIGRPLLEAVPEVAEQGLLPLLKNVLTTAQPYIAKEEAVTITVNGKATTFYFDRVFQPFYEDNSGTVTGVFTLSHDVTELVLSRRRAEEASKEFQFVTNTVPQLVWATEPDGYAYFFNERWLEYTGLKLEEVKGDGWTHSLHLEDKERAFSVWRKAVETGSAYDVEYRLKGYDGEYRWFVARGTPMKDMQGNILKWYGTTTDIQEQKLAQEKLQQSKERFDLVSKATQDAIWDWNLLTNEIWWNEGFKELFGYTAEEIEPTIISWYGRVHPDDTERVVGGIHKVIDSGGKQWSDEYRFRKRDGSYALVFDRGYALHDSEGKPYRMLGSMQDITVQRLQQEKIKASEERFEAAVAAVEGIVWTNNAEGHMEGEQPAWQTLTGQSFEEYSGQGWANVIHPEDAQPTVDAWAIALRERRTFVFEHRVKTQKAGWRHFSVRAIPLLTADGSVREWVGVHTDITEQRLNEERIRHSEQRFQNLIREASVGIIVLTGDELRVEVVNQAYGKLIDRRVDELLNHPLFDIIPEAEDPFRAFLNGVRDSGQPFYLYDQPYKVNGKEQTIEGYLNIVYQPYKEVDGTTAGVMVLCQDITGQVIARKKAAEAEETARLAIDSAGLGTFHVDILTNKLQSSERLDQIFDVTNPGERSRYIDAIHPDDLPIRNKAYETARQTGLLEYEGRVIQKSGAIRWFRVKGRMWFDEQKQPTEIVGVVMDITEEKVFSEELTRQVKERTQDLEQFSYVSHHDLQEPLRKIIMFTEMIRAEAFDSLPEISQRRLDKVTSAARRMSTALKDVLNFASLNKQDLLREVQLNEIVEAVQTDLELVIQEKDANIQVGPLPAIQAIPQQMQQLFYNLLNNALKFSKENHEPVIHIRSWKLTKEELLQHPDLLPTKEYYRIEIQDNGIGFKQQSAEKIFGLFQRLHNRESYAGTGIGLALCKKVVTNHGGEISATSNEGEGATFTIVLPEA